MDIRIMRRIIEVLDENNKMGVDVRAVWDVENLFSLENVLPRYAPDIIDNIRRRVKEGRDEVIVMSYNNALASALTESEFDDSITRAVSNLRRSGVKDVFGTWSSIVRPQEMMTTAGNFYLYRKHGIDAISLYYSAITFDSLRVFLRPLSPREAFNPLQYRDPVTGESIRVMPTYNVGDLIENVSLQRWAREIHREQVRGNIDSDVLIFVNFDADDSYWYGYTLPSYLSWLPNTGGLRQLIAGIRDLEYVRFTTLSEYLKTHGDHPLRTGLGGRQFQRLQLLGGEDHEPSSLDRRHEGAPRRGSREENLCPPGKARAPDTGGTFEGIVRGTPAAPFHHELRHGGAVSGSWKGAGR